MVTLLRLSQKVSCADNKAFAPIPRGERQHLPDLEDNAYPEPD